jgi:hypothetical protein
MTVDIIQTTYSLPDKIAFAQALAGSSLIPQHYRSQPANVLVAIELGNALGIAPIVAINEVNVINGSPSLSASLMAALARQAGHKVRVTGDDTAATCDIVRSDDSDFTYSVTWDEKKARNGGLWGKGHWAKDPGLMLKWRAISECVRLACSEVLGGVKYTPQEIEDMAPPTVTQVPVPPAESAARPPSIRDAIASRQAFEVVPATLKQEPAEAAPTEPPVNLRTDAQAKKLAVLMRENGMDNRDEALAYFGSLIGRDIDSTKELTKGEASKVIDALASAKDAGVDPQTGEVVDAEIVDDWPATAGVR